MNNRRDALWLKETSRQLDIDEFKAASRYSLYPAGQELTVDQVSILEKAVELYRGDLLEGIYEGWCSYERERLRLVFLNMLIRLVDHHVLRPLLG